MYRVNLRVCQAFYPILNLFEIFLRNTINYRISGYFADPNWIINQKNGFMSDNSLQGTKFFLKESVTKAERMIRKRGGHVTSGKIIAEQPLGFWNSLFEPHHYRLVGGSVIKCFAGKPSHIQRKDISYLLNEIRIFRNRIYHNEPVCFKGNIIDFTNAWQIRDYIYQLLNWIDPNLPAYVQYFDSVPEKIHQANHI